MTGIRLAQRLLAFALPCAILAPLAVRVLRSGLTENLILAGGALFVVSALLARFLMARSRNQEAKFVTVRISPDDDETMQRFTDVASFVAAFVLVACAVLLSL